MKVSVRFQFVLLVAFLSLPGCFTERQTLTSRDYARKAFNVYNTPLADQLDRIYQQYLVELPDGQTKLKYEEMLASPAITKAIESIIEELEGAPINFANYNQQKALFINIYNILTIHRILQNWDEVTTPSSSFPFRSIRNIGTSDTAIWQNSDYGIRVLGQSFTLDQIEKERLLKVIQPKDARIHFAVNCASVGCPPLSKFAFRDTYPEGHIYSSLDQHLDDLTFDFVNNEMPIAVLYEPGNFTETVFDNELGRNKTVNYMGKLKITELLSWYRADFEGPEVPWNSLYEFIYDYMDSDTKLKYSINSLEDLKKWKIEFFSYDWELNDTN